MIENIPKRNIGQTNVQISELGLGCAPLGGNLVDLSREEAAALIYAAMENGIEYFDTAPWHGLVDQNVLLVTVLGALIIFYLIRLEGYLRLEL